MSSSPLTENSQPSDIFPQPFPGTGSDRTNIPGYSTNGNIPRVFTSLSKALHRASLAGGMEVADDEENLGLVKASVGLLADLENGIQKVVWKSHTTILPRNKSIPVHSQVKKRDLEWLVQLV